MIYAGLAQLVEQRIRNAWVGSSSLLTGTIFLIFTGFPKMNKYEELVAQCHKAMELAIDAPYSVDLLRLRQKLINEEAQELNVEIDHLIQETQENGLPAIESVAKMYKELADLQYVVSGMAVSLGIPMEEVFARVHQSNMSKLVDGKPLKREDGKFLKGPNYKKPVLDDLVKIR